MMKRFSLLGAAALLALGAATAPQAQAQPKPTTLRMVPHADLKTLDPLFNTAYITRNHGYMVFDTLFAQDSHGQPKPQMVQSWTTSPDGKSWTFTLRPGLKFNDGTPVTAEDCVASLQRWAKKDTLGQAMMAAGAELAATSADTFTLTLKQPFGLVLDALAKPSGMPPFILPKRLALTDPNTQVTEMVGSGPFLFKRDEWVPGNKVVYVKNPAYVPRAEPADGLAGGKVAKVDRVEWIYIPDGNTATAALMNGEVDMIEQTTPDFLPVLESNPDITLSTSVASQGMVIVNALHPPFDKPQARQALYYLVNQKEMVSAIGYPEKYRVDYCPTLYICGSPLATDAGAAPYAKTDLARAKQLLKEAGYQGEKVVLLYPTDHISAPAVMVMAQNMKKAGINVDLQSMDWASLAARRLKKDPPAQGGWNVFLTWGGYFDASTPVTNPWLSAACGNSLPGWPCDKELDTLRTQWIQETDAAKRKEIAAQLQARAYQTVPYVMWGEFKPVSAVRGLKHTELMKTGIPVMWNVEKP
ncbi:Glutathione-binding protein GsiB [Achromobacter deleyi]|uniref:Glutathione-binding protein GsiB n=1 Tax=Achromobacter deleyi TaxID=1353891 RepID=A0A6S7A0N8_9BURK|nr:ABC transporter substrate-binding protein [Achromobacter deleyi]CAB3706578.1 Glutathione-binding protein GsiB [Achromobacter deleyi]CAB3879788.1 Glutathione-binding protein GsiB [Achromobacter deleyi]CAB3912061.1 Glutathione-binding protein GsiB [Achromobacter deleyi]